MKFLVPNYSCLQNPWLGGYSPQIPVLSVLNWFCWPPHLNKIPGYATDYVIPKDMLKGEAIQTYARFILYLTALYKAEK